MHAYRPVRRRARPRRSSLAVAAALAVLVCAGEAGAASKTWNCSNSIWDAAACWLPGGAPGSADSVVVSTVAGGSSTLGIDSLTSKILGGPAAANYLLLGSSSPATMATLQQTGSTLLVSATTFVGYLGRGTYNQYGGSFTTNTEVVGYGATGTVNQSDGSHAVTNGLFLGVNQFDFGTYNLSGGTLNAGSVVVGEVGQGTVQQTGGRVIAAPD